ncbi:rab-GTPase-TBC domain-containing protein [Helicostylum pulchrum]|nr:rab-GTPase-TBC domain-containing protein [Helicostylum pulchrum]
MTTTITVTETFSSAEEMLLTTPQVVSTTTQLEENVIKIRPIPSKSAENNQQTLLYDISPEKSTSLTLAERRNNIPASLKLYTEKTWCLKEQETLIRNIVSKLESAHTLEEDTVLMEDAITLEKKIQLLTTTEISTDMRPAIWISLCQPSLKVQSLYDTLVSGPFDAIIERDQPNPVVARILKAYSVYDTQVGYHSTLAALITPFLDLNIPENQIFSVFVRLMETYDMRQMYTGGLGLVLEQFKSLFTSICPKLESHFSRLSVQPSMYATQWFLTLFNMPHVMRLYDLVWLQGAVQTMIRTSIWILQQNEKTLSTMTESKEIVSFLNNVQLQQDINVNEILCISIHTIDLHFGTPVQQQQQQLHLQKQVQDLANALSQLQREHTALSQDNMKLRMHEMDGEAAQSKLYKRNTFLEKRVKKYKIKLANSVADIKTNNNNQENNEPALLDHRAKRQDQFSSFVASLRDSGDFGALIAGALAPTVQDLAVATATAAPVVEEQEEKESNQNKLDTALQNVTSELVAVKLDHFETCQRYQSLANHCQNLTAQMNSMQESQTVLCQKVIYLESELEDVVTERDQIYADQEEVLAMAMVAKKTCAELQVEKMGLAKEVEKLESHVKDLQEEKNAFFMPRGTFSEEVFAAHTILFGSPPKKPKEEKDELNRRRHTLQQPKQQEADEYKSKFVDSELRCRELEKYLAETKVKLAEFESGGGTPRGSLQQPRRAASNKRNSTASLSMLANRTITPPRERRESTESYASSTTSLTSLNSSNYNSKRSSMYSRIWSAFGSPPATPTTTNNTIMMKNSMIMCEEPQIIQ